MVEVSIAFIERRMLIALEQLPLEQRSVLWLVDAKNLPYEEVSRQLGIPIQKIPGLLKVARLKTYQLLNPPLTE